MKKQLTVILLSALILSGCASGRMGNPGAIMAGASITQERKDNGWIFSDGYYNATQTFVVAQGSDVKSCLLYTSDAADD